MTNIRTKRKPGTNPALIHTKHTISLLLDLLLQKEVIISPSGRYVDHSPPFFCHLVGLSYSVREVLFSDMGICKFHLLYCLVPDPIDLRQEMTMAAPQIVSIVYGIANPIRLSPKIKMDPTIPATARIAIKRIRTVPIIRPMLPFTLSISLDIALMFFL